jgi:hypothetical protein
VTTDEAVCKNAACLLTTKWQLLDLLFCVVRTVHFGVKEYNYQRNAQFLNLFIYLLLPYMFRAFFQPIFRGRRTNSAVVYVSWVWYQRPAQDGTQILPDPGADTIPRRLEPLPKLYACL